jgi:large subunit ribosomal protein L25
MSLKLNMTAQKREGTGKGTARALRREEKVPAVIYGNKQEPYTITLDEKDITLEYHKGHLFTTLVNLNVDGEDTMVLARDVQTHAVKDNILHVDFLRVSDKTKIAVMIPVHFTDHDKSPALSEKGILNTVRHEVELMCKATNIPEYLEVSLAGKVYHDSVNISDATMPEGVTPVIADRDFTIATIVEPKKAEDLDEELAEGEVAADEVPSSEQDGENFPDNASNDDKSE